MVSRIELINDLRYQREILDGLLGRLGQKKSLELVDYQLCESTAEAVEKGLQRIRRLSIEEFVKEALWGKDVGRILA